MALHGVQDPRVVVWNSSKFTSRVNKASSSGLPVLLRLDYESGHGVGSTQSQRNAERADLISFMLWQFGEPGFQPELAASGPDGDTGEAKVTAPGGSGSRESCSSHFLVLAIAHPSGPDHYHPGV